ncbi:MAG: glycosyltransferase [Bacteroidales bacterium]|nr:glycosyltransferase [Bacteroidales bacterium]
MKKLAVIMSLYNNDMIEYVKLAVESILSQTYKDFIFYIQYDGPIDSDVNDYLLSLIDERVQIRKRMENKGLAQSLNDLLAIVKPQKYEFIARMDADDISLPDRFEKQIAYLMSNLKVDLVGGAINEINENGNDRGKITRYPCNPDDCRSFFAKRNPVAHPTVMFRRSFFEKTGWEYPMDYMRNEDTRLWHEGYKHGCVIANLPDVLLNFRITDAMFTQRRNGKEFAKSQYELRKIINKDLQFGFMSNVYAFVMYLLMISPSWLLKLAYRVLR